MEKRDLPWVDYFHIDQEMMRKTLSIALSRGGDYADLFFEHRIVCQVTLDEQSINNASHGVVSGLGIRVIKNDSVGFAFVNELEPDSMRRAAEQAAQIASSPRAVGEVDVRHLTLKSYYPVVAYPSSKDIEPRLKLMSRAEAAARRYHSTVTGVSVLYSDRLRYLQFLDAEGRFWRDVQPLVRMDVYVVAEKAGVRQSSYYGGGGRYGLEYFGLETPESLAEEAARMTVQLLDAREAPSGSQEVVLGCADSGILLHEAVGHGLEADFNRKRLSNYSDRIGQLVASPGCTIVDNGAIPHLRGSVNCDDEGHPSQENVLIEKGILRGYMHDRVSAQQIGVSPTGNGRRQSYRHVPLPRMTNTYMLPGPYSAEEIISSVKRGVYAKRFGGGEVDIAKGDFVFSTIESYLIENGRLTAPLKGVSLVGNGPQVMERVTMVGNDLQFASGIWTCGKRGQTLPVGVGMPTVKISQITVGGTGR